MRWMTTWQLRGMTSGFKKVCRNEVPGVTPPVGMYSENGLSELGDVADRQAEHAIRRAQ